MKTLLLLLSSALPAACALGPDFCASCHEIRPLIDNWKTSTHRGIECALCRLFLIVRFLSGRLLNTRFIFRIRQPGGRNSGFLCGGIECLLFFRPLRLRRRSLVR